MSSARPAEFCIAVRGRSGSPAKCGVVVRTRAGPGFPMEIRGAPMSNRRSPSAARVGGAKAWYGARPMSAVRQLECRSGAERVLSREWQGANRPGRRYRKGRADSAISTRFVVEVDGRPATAAIRERESQGRTAMNTRAHWRIWRRRGCARQRGRKSRNYPLCRVFRLATMRPVFRIKRALGRRRNGAARRR